MGLEYGNHPKEIFTRANGYRIGSMVRVCFDTERVLIKENSKISLKMGSELRILLMETPTKENTTKASLMEKADTNGIKADTIRANFHRGCEKAEVNGWTRMAALMKVIINVF